MDQAGIEPEKYIFQRMAYLRYFIKNYVFKPFLLRCLFLICLDFSIYYAFFLENAKRNAKRINQDFRLFSIIFYLFQFL